MFTTKFVRLTALITAFLFTGLLASQTAEAHCDRVNGPVAKDARKALETGDPAEALIWVGEEQEEELRSAFEQSLDVYETGGESRELAERYFMETTVRLHRQAEGMPYTGLKPAQPGSEDIQVAEEALDTGNLDPVTDLLAREIEKKTAELYQAAMKAKDRKNESVSSGREWADAYVRYIVYVHSLYGTIQEGPPHGVGE